MNVGKSSACIRFYIHFQSLYRQFLFRIEIRIESSWNQDKKENLTLELRNTQTLEYPDEKANTKTKQLYKTAAVPWTTGRSCHPEC